MASTVASDLDDSIDVSVFEQSSPESLRARAPSQLEHDDCYSTSDRHTLINTDDESFRGRKYVQQCTSSRSSISSFPTSVIHTIPFTDNEDFGSRTPSRSQLGNGRQSPAYRAPPNSYLSAFRHPNSVRALQLESDYADSDTQSIARSPRHRGSPRSSYFGPRSPGSAHSSPTKRSSRPATPQPQRSSSKLKKEFPLVLLHCTLLSPAVTSRAQTVSEEILEAVLPEEYRKRWRILQDKVAKNTEVKQRGVLIAHPRDDYDLLEERLLEALELERPRIRKGHYIGANGGDSDSGFESSSQNGTDEASDTEEREGDVVKNKCPDCGTSVSCHTEQERRWEVKAFAANGLMRSGAWSAAWEQMEKVDVEVSVWMPEEVRIEVEERLKALQAKEEAERPVEEPVDPVKKKRTRSNTARLRHDERMREIYGEPEAPRTQEEIDGLADEKGPESSTPTAEPINIHEDLSTQQSPEQPTFQIYQQHQVPVQPDFVTFMKHHFNAIISDQRNLAIVLLSMLVLFFSVQNAEFGSSSSKSSQTEAVSSVSASIALDAAVSSVNVDVHSVAQAMTTISSAASQMVSMASVAEAQLESSKSPEASEGVGEHLPVFFEHNNSGEVLSTEATDEEPSSSSYHRTERSYEQLEWCHPPAWKVLHNLQSGHAAGMCMAEE